MTRIKRNSSQIQVINYKQVFYDLKLTYQRHLILKKQHRDIK